MDINEKVKNVIVEQLGVSSTQVTPEALFIEDLEADSLDTVEMLMALEEQFGILIDDEEATTFKTVGDVYSFIQAKAKK